MNATVSHEWGTNLFVIEGNGTTKTLSQKNRQNFKKIGSYTLL
jgi:hypothetical protein